MKNCDLYAGISNTLFDITAHPSQIVYIKLHYDFSSSFKRSLLRIYILPSLKSIQYLLCKQHNQKWASTRENLSSGFANNAGADQPAHPRSLISAFVIRFLERIICILATGEI